MDVNQIVRNLRDEIIGYTAEIAELRKLYERRVNQYNVLGVMKESLGVQKDNVNSATTILIRIKNALIPYKIEILKSAQEETIEYAEELITNYKKIGSIIEKITTAQDKINSELEKISKEASALDAKKKEKERMLQAYYNEYGGMVYYV